MVQPSRKKENACCQDLTFSFLMRTIILLLLLDFYGGWKTTSWCFITTKWNGVDQDVGKTRPSIVVWMEPHLCNFSGRSSASLVCLHVVLHYLNTWFKHDLNVGDSGSAVTSSLYFVICSMCSQHPCYVHSPRDHTCWAVCGRPRTPPDLRRNRKCELTLLPTRLQRVLLSDSTSVFKSHIHVSSSSVTYSYLHRRAFSRKFQSWLMTTLKGYIRLLFFHRLIVLVAMWAVISLLGQR